VASAPPARPPRVSCLITTYQLGHLVGRAVRSALAQDVGAEHLEVVVVDDGSTDDTPAVLAAFGDAIRVVRKPNGGLVSSVNRAIAEATGEFLTFLDGDDEWPPDKVRRQLERFAGRPELGLVYSDLETVDEAGRVLEPSYFRMLGLTPPRGRIFGATLTRNYAPGGAMMVRAALAPLWHPLDERLVCHDWPIAAAVAAVAEADLVDAPLYRYRRHGANMNLGVAAAGRLRLTRGENEIRRRLLAGAQPGQATEAELLEACATLAREYEVLASGLGTALGELVAVDAADRAAADAARAAAAAAQHAGNRQVALCRLVNAVAHDPVDRAARAALVAAARGDDGWTEDAPARALPDVRGLVVLAFADELAADPGLLAGYAEAFAAGDDATLVVYAPGWDDDRAAAELPPALAAAGVHPEHGPDLLAVALDPDPGRERRLAAEVHAVLSAGPAGEPFARLPRFGADRVADLRALAGRHWRALAA
jgi:hypothetical protein